MSSDLHLEQQQEKYQEALAHQKSIEAATLVVVQEMSRADAVRTVTEIHNNRDDASLHETIPAEVGVDYIGEDMDLPRLPKDDRKTKQIHKIAKELIDEFS